MGLLERLINRILNSIPKQAKEDFHYITYTAATAGLYIIGLISVVLFTGYLLKGCNDKQETKKPVTESRLEESCVTEEVILRKNPTSVYPR